MTDQQRGAVDALTERDERMMAEGWDAACQALILFLKLNPSDGTALSYMVEHNPFRTADDDLRP